MSQGHKSIKSILGRLFTGMVLLSLSMTGLNAQIGGEPVTWLTATPGDGSVELSWNPVVDTFLNKYIILRGTSIWNLSKIDSINNPTTADTTYIDFNVTNDTTYYYTLWYESMAILMGNSDTVSVTPTDKLVAELLAGVNTTSTGGTDQGYPLNTFYHDTRYQALYQAQDLINAGLNPGANIVAVEIFPSQSPGQALNDFRIATAWTGSSSLSSFVTTTVGYGPTYHNPEDFPMGTWVRFPIEPIAWNGNDHLVLEFSHDNGSYTDGGGVYLHQAGPGRAIRGWSDSQAGNYPFDGNLSQTGDDKVPWLRLVYTEPAVLPPTNLVATGLYGQVNLSWTASISNDVAKVYIYRGTQSDTLTLIDSVDVGSTTFSDGTVQNETIYWYAVSAKNTDGEESSKSSPVKATPQVAAPTNFTALPGSRQVTLSWTAATGNGVARTLIYQGTTRQNLILVDSTSSATATSKIITGLANGVTYYFRARTRALDNTVSDTTNTVMATPNYFGPVWWVATSGSNTGDGSETDPFLTIQHAIDIADDGDTVKIKPGTYTGYGNYNLTLNGTELVVMGVGGPDSVTIDVQGSASSPRRGFYDVYHNYSDTTKIVGLHIINGYAPFTNDPRIGEGGGMFFQNAGDLTIENCVIGPGNKAIYGAGISIVTSDPDSLTLKNVVIKGNSNPNNPGGFYYDYHGMGLRYEGNSNSLLTINSSIIRGNSGSVISGEEVYIYGGGIAIYGYQTEVRLINSLIAGNTLNQANAASVSYGGGLYIQDQTLLYIINTDIVYNSVSQQQNLWNGQGGALWVGNNSTTINILNSIIWGNSAEDGSTDMANNNNPTIQVHYSDLQTATTGDFNMSVNPRFNDASSGDFTLDPASLLIGAGIGSGTTYPGQDLVPTYDLVGNVRPNPTGSNPDVGAYESALATTPYPSKPQNLAATAGDGQVTLTWTANSETDIAKYGIYYGTSANPTVKQAETTNASTTTYDVTGLNNNITYYFRITAIDNDNYESGFSNEVTATPQYSGTDVYVDIDSLNAGYTPDGSASKPYGSIQAAIDAVSDGVRILVKPGTYTGIGTAPIIDLKGKQIVLESVDGPATTIINGGGSSGNRIALSLNAQNGFYNGYTTSTQIIGFTFTNGDDEEYLVDIHGPDYWSNSSLPWSPKFVNCRFTSTSKTSGGIINPAIYIREAAPVFDGCEFRGLSMNPVSNINIWGELRAPIVLEGSYDSNDPNIYAPQFLNSVIAGNSNSLPTTVSNEGIDFKGGAVYIGFGMAPVFENTRIDSNTVDATNGPTNFSWSQSAGGAVYIDDYYNDTPTPIQFNNCSISYNTVKGMEALGGGLYSEHPYTQLTNCLVVGNEVYSIYDPNNQHPSAGGGGIYAEINPSGWGNYPGSGPTYGPTMDLINVTIAGNQVTTTTNGGWGGAGVARNSTMHFTIFNTIIAENDVAGLNDPARENMATEFNSFGSGSLDVGYALITDANDAGIAGDYLLDASPGFVGNGNYSLDISSKAIGKGGASYGTLTAPATDYYGNSRPTTSYDPGNGTYGPDLGAIENSLTVSPYPNAPENLMVVDENDSTVTLSWTAPEDNDVVKYRIYSDTFSPAASLTDSVSGVTTHTVRHLNNGTTYYFRVTAVDLDGYESDFSNEVSGTPAYKGPVWYVDDASSTVGSAHDGSPANPFGEIQDVFDNAPINPGDTILVLPGTYNSGGNRNLHAPDFPFVLMSQDGPDTTVIDLSFGSNPKYRFFTFDNEMDTSTQVIGFTIQNGGGYDELNNPDFGGAMRFVGFWDWGQNRYLEANPLIRNCRFVNNTIAIGSEGGAVYISGSSPVFDNCTFTGNTSHEKGGAVYVENRSENTSVYQSTPVFRNCVFGNNATLNTAGEGGGALYSDGSPEITLDRCRFEGNNADEFGGALRINYWDQALQWLTIKNTLFAGNSTRSSGGGQGAAIWIEGDNVELLMEHVTITDNASNFSNAAIHTKNAFIYNSIIWNNSLDADGSPINGLYGDVEILNSLVENGDLMPGFDSQTGLTVDPVFTDPANGDYTLSLASFALGAGATQYYNPHLQSVVTIRGTDLAGNARIQPNGSNPDMGAYEASWAETPYPDAPSNLSAEPLHHGVQLNWNFPVADDVARYFIYQSLDLTNWTPVDTVTGRLVTRTTLSGLTNGTIYYYYVSAQDTANYESLPSNGVSVVPKYQGPVWYVDDDGPVFGGEGSAENPFKAILDAVRVSDDGDTILILPGLYNSSADWNINLQDVPIGNPPLPYVRNLVIIGSEGPDSTIIDLGGFGQFLEVVSGEEASISGLTVQNGSANDYSAVIKVENSQFSIDRCVFKNNTNTGSAGAVVLTGNSQSHITVTNSQFIGNVGNNSVGVFFADNIDISNSVFYQNSARLGAAFGWNPPPGATASIVNCLFLDNTSTEGGSGGAIWIQSNIITGISIYNSIFWGNSGNGSDPDVGDARNGVHNCVVQNLSSYSADNYSFDPMIVAPEDGDFSLSEYSPAIGRGIEQYFDFSSGTYAAIPATDFYGNPRPQPEGSLPDLGPIEHERDVQRYFVYSVAPTPIGSDQNDGLTAPFATIQRALNEANDFDTVEVGPGTYVGAGNIQLDFAGVKTVLRSAEGPQITSIDCENIGFGVEFSSGEGPEVIFEGFTIKRGASPEGGSAVRVFNSSPTLRNLVLVNNATNGSGAAVAIDNGDPQFVNCILFGNTGNSGTVYTTDGNPVFDHCTIVNNTNSDGSGAFVVDGGSLTVHNSIIWDNTLAGEEILDIPGTSSLDVSYSLVMGDFPGDAIYIGRPALVNPIGGDFHLEDYSPAIGWADTSAFVSLDILGNPRTVSDTTAPDLGAVESALARPDTSGYTPMTFWVDVNGNDASNGLSPADAFATIQRAVNFTIWSDTVKLLPGHFTQDFKTSRKDVTILGAGSLPLTRISGTAYLHGGSPSLSHLAFRGTNVALDMNNSTPELSFLEFSNNNGAPGLLVLQHSSPNFDHVTVVDNAGILYHASDSSTITVKNSVVYNTGGGSDADGTTSYEITYSLTSSSGTGNLDLDPGFRAGSYRLLASSLLINAGDPNDVDEDGTRADMGAYPYLTNHTGPDWYVSELGNDTTATGSEFNPFASVQAGLNFAGMNDTIWVDAGTYVGLAQTRGRDVALIGDDWESTVLTGDGTGDVLTFDSAVTSQTLAKDLQITGSGVGFAGVRLNQASPTFDHCWIEGNDTGMAMNQSSPTLQYCLITDNDSDGLFALEGLPLLINNTIANNGGVGILQTSAARAVMDSLSGRNLIVWNNGNGDVSGNVSLTYSDYSGAVGTGNISADPLFVDDVNGDYALDLLSPCIDTGDSTDSFDADSTVRDMGALPNIRTFLGGTTTDNIEITPDTVIIVDEDLIISSDDTLTIQPGGTLYLGDGVTLFVEGELDVQGNQDGPVQFSTLYPGETFGGVRIQGGSARTIPVYRYLSISNVMTDSIPLIISGSAVLEHVTIAGNDPNVASLQVNGGSVDLNYCILESGVNGTFVDNNSYLTSTDQFVDLANGDFNLVPDAVGIDVGVEEAAQYVDPDFTYTDAGAYYHDQSLYPVAAINILYPANGTTVLVSPDTSALVGLTTEVQLFNQYGRYKTNGHVFWNTNNTFGYFGQDSTSTTDLDGKITNIYTTSTATGDANTFVVSADGVTSETSGTFLIEPGVPDSVWVVNQIDTVMTQLDTIIFSAWVYDQFENLVRDGETIDWSVVPLVGNGDGFVLSAPQSQTAGGMGMIALQTDPSTALQVGDQVRIQANSNGAVHQSGVITIVPDDVFNLTMPPSLTENQIDLSADVATILLSATLVDTFDNPLEGVDVNWAVIEGAGTGESLSSGVTTTDAAGYTEVTLTTGTVSGLQYRVRTWVTQGALLTALRNGNESDPSPEDVGTSRESKKGSSSVVKGIKGKSTNVKLAVQGKVLRSVGENQDLGSGYSTEAVFGLSDTTAVIQIVPGVTTTVTLPTDSVDVVPGQTLDLTLEAVDQFGNLVADGTAVAWELVPSSSNVTVVSFDDTTTNGNATIHLEISTAAEWEFDFKVQATVEGVTSLSGTYNVDDQIAPAAPLSVIISPSEWTSTNSFNLTWTNPAEHSGIAGVHYQIDSEPEVYVAGTDIASLSGLAIPQNGISTITLWLEDQAGNTESTNSISVTAKWDDVVPNSFNLQSPLAGWYNNAVPELKWDATTDATSSLRIYRLNLDGTSMEFDPSVVSYQVTSPLSEGSHTWTVFAVDSAWNEIEASNPQTIQIDVTNPAIAHNPVLEGNANSFVTITASFSDGGSGIDRAELYYRKGGQLTWQPAVDMKTLSTYQIASGFVTSVGVEYYLETEDVAGNITRKPESGFYSISITVTGDGIASADRWPTGITNGTSVKDYQLISFPMQAANNTPTDILVDDLGSYDNTKWRFFTYDAGTWLEFADITSIDPGKSYFLIVKDPGLSINTGQVRSVNTDESFAINLSPGEWTFIGNPFNFNISLDMVTVDDTISLTGDPNFYTWDSDWITTNKLEPWHGYIYKSDQGGQLKINPRNATGRMMPKSMVLDQPLEDNEWLVTITATNGALRDGNNQVGMLNAAKDGFDRLDAYEPPVLPGNMALRIDDRDWPEAGDVYRRDIRSVNDEGQYWDLEVLSGDPGSLVNLQFDGLSDIPEDFDIFIVDLTLGTAQNLRWNSTLRFASSSTGLVHRLRFIAGTREFASANSGGVSLVPEAYAVSQNFPNPFNPQTTINIGLEEGAQIRLAIYNILGEEVAVLANNEYRPAGYYSFIWTGRNTFGRRVASGVYFYITEITAPDGAPLLRDTRKMVLVK